MRVFSSTTRVRTFLGREDILAGRHIFRGLFKELTGEGWGFGFGCFGLG